MYRRNNYLHFIFLVIVVVIQSLNASFSQQQLVGRFEKYTANTIQEKLFLHTDKEVYVSGEIMWFKVYYVELSSHRPLAFSKIAYVELLNEKGEAVLQSKVSLDSAKDNGSFYLPTLLPTGHYVLRSYTSWMKNFGRDLFFEKKITIINTLTVTEKSQAADSVFKPIISFFPEGGVLVNGLKSKVGVLLKNKYGNAVNGRGYIMDNVGDTAAYFSTIHNGMGSFEFTPLQDKTYTAVMEMQGNEKVSMQLPSALNSGYVMRVNSVSGNTVQVEIQRRKMNGEKEEEEIMLAAHTKSKLWVAGKGTITESGHLTFAIEKSRLGKGVIHFTLFNSNDQPLCERLIFEKPEYLPAINITPAKNIYANREQIDLSMDISKDILSKNYQYLLSASVYKMDSLADATPSGVSLQEYLWLTSELNGVIESPSYYFSKSPQLAEATDCLMLTYGWRKFKWDNLLRRDMKLITYLPELHGHIVMAKLTDKRDGSVGAKKDVYLSVTGKYSDMYISKSDSNGIVRFEIKDIYGNKQMIAQPVDEKDSVYKVEILKPFVEETTTNKFPFLSVPAANAGPLLQRSLSMQVQNVFAADSMRNFLNPDISDTLPFYARPETTYELDLYKRFTTMEEVLREYVTGVDVVARRGGLAIKMFNPDIHDFYSTDPLVMVDGVPLQDVNRIFSYDPLKVRKLDVIQGRYVYGTLMFSGIVSFTTYEGEFDGFELNPQAISIDYAGLQLQREFYSPQYTTAEQKASRMPDFRTTLMWKPDLKTNNDGKAHMQFFSSDSKGKFLVVVQGLNADGQSVSGTTGFEVK